MSDAVAGTPSPAPSYTHVLQVDKLPKNRAYDFELVPDTQALAALAGDLGILGLRKVVFSGEISFDDNGDAHLTGTLGATATQACVVTLEPVRTRIEAPVTRHYVKHLDITEEEHQLLPEDDENTDPLGHTIDLGQVLTESIALELPDFPKAEGAALTQSDYAAPGVKPMTDDDAKPFAGLAALKDKLSN